MNSTELALMLLRQELVRYRESGRIASGLAVASYYRLCAYNTLERMRHCKWEASPVIPFLREL